jgi:ribonuclease-3
LKAEDHRSSEERAPGAVGRDTDDASDSSDAALLALDASAAEPPTFEQFAAHLQIEPRHHPLLRQALTHRSQSDLAPHGDNERLEFLGDSILGMLVNEYLYLAYPSASEGELTRMKANVVSEPSLAEAARELGLGPLLDLARGEEAGGGRDRPSILSDAFEAVLAAVYLARAIIAARSFVHQHLITATDPLRDRDHKSVLQELMQETRRSTPSYQIVETVGPAHNREFIAEVHLDGQSLGTGRGRSKKQAEQAAALAALEQVRPPKKRKASSPRRKRKAPAAASDVP